MTERVVAGLLFCAFGIGIILFHSRVVEMRMRSYESKWWPLATHPTRRFTEVEMLLGALGAIAFGLFLLALAFL